MRRSNLPRRWFRVACISYDSDYMTYLGRLRGNQPHPIFRKRRTALLHAQLEIRAIEKMGVSARIWQPLPAHRDSGHIHIVALVAPAELKKLFPTEYEGVR